MNPEITTAIVAAIGVIGTAIGWGIRLVFKKLVNFLEELKPNGGGSMKDQVTRLEARHDKLDSKIDQLTLLLVDHIGKDK